MTPIRRKIRIVDHAWTQHNWLEKLAIFGAVLVCGLVGHIVARTLGFPSAIGFNGSVVSSSSILALIVIPLFAVVGGAFFATFVVGWVEFDAPLVCASAGLAWLAGRSGSVGATLRTTASGSIYSTFIIEQAVFLLMIVLAFYLLYRLAQANVFPAEIDGEANESQDDWQTRATAIGAQAVAAGVLLMVLIPLDSKQHSLIVVGIAGYLGSLLTYNLFPTKGSVWPCIGLMLTGLAGHIWASGNPGNWQIGTPANALAAVTPLDYASLGICGTIMGYWSGRRMRYNASSELQSGQTQGQKA